MATTRKQKIAREAFCIGENRLLPIDNFYISYNPWHSNGVLPYCSDCCNKMVYDNLEKAGNLEAALWLTCAEVGVPFIKDAYLKVEMESKSTDSRICKAIVEKRYKYFDKYFKALNKKRTAQKQYATFYDTDVALGDVKTIQKSEELLRQQLEELNLIWGRDFAGDDYSLDALSYLEWRYTVYTEGITLTEYQASRYRDLCKEEYNIANGIDVQNAMKRKVSAAQDLHINEFATNKEKTEVEKMIEYDAYIMEKQEPCDFFDQEELYKDYSYSMKDYIKYVARPIRNLIMGSKDYNVDENSKYGD